MNAVPRKYYDEELKTLGVDYQTLGLVLECEIASPPSSKGKTVYVYFTVEETTKLLLEAKRSATLSRSRTAQ